MSFVIRRDKRRDKRRYFCGTAKGYEKKRSEEMVYKLEKALYGLKQVPRTWFSPIESYFIRRKGGKI